MLIKIINFKCNQNCRAHKHFLIQCSIVTKHNIILQFSLDCYPVVPLGCSILHTPLLCYLAHYVQSSKFLWTPLIYKHNKHNFKLPFLWAFNQVVLGVVSGKHLCIKIVRIKHINKTIDLCAKFQFKCWISQLNG